MGWFKNAMAGVAARAAKYAGIPLRDPALVALLGSAPTTSGVDVDEITALNYSAVWAAVNIVSANIAAMPPVPMKLIGEGHRVADNHWSYDLLLIEPSCEMTPFTFVETVQGHAMTWGNGYALLKRENEDAPVTSMSVLPPNQTEPFRDEDGRVKYAFTPIYDGEKKETYEAWEVLHIAGMGYDGLKGYPVIHHAAESIGLLGAVEKYGAAFFGRGSTPGGILELAEGQDLSEKAKKNLRESFELIHRGPENAHRVAILGEGMKYKTIGLPLETAQFLQTRLMQIAEVARWFNVPLHLLRELSHATYSNIEHQGIDFLVYTLRPWLIRWQQEYRRKLFAKNDRRKYCVMHDTDNLLMTDIKSRYEAYRVGREGGWLDLDTIAKKEKANPIGGVLGASRLVPSNMRAVDKDGNDVFADNGTRGIETSAMNGIQVQSMLSVVQACAAEQVHPDTASSMLRIAFPDVPQSLIDSMLQPIRDGKIDPATVAPVPTYSGEGD